MFKKIIVLTFFALMLTMHILAGDDQTAPKITTPAKITPTEIQWMDYDDGMALAKKENKHVFANFTAKWCGYCKKMNKTTFLDPDIVKILSESFISVKIDGDSRDTLNIDGYKITNRNLAKSEYGVGSYPTYWFLDDKGTKLGYIRGYQSKEQLFSYLKYVASREYEKTQEKPAPKASPGK